MSSSQGLVGQEDTALIDKEVLILTLRMRNFAYAPTQIPIPRPFFVRGVDVPLISYLGEFDDQVCSKTTKSLLV